MKNPNKIILLLFAVTMVILTACNRTPTPSAEMVITNVAQTVQADLTQIAASIPTNTPTLAPTPTLTLELITPTLAPSDTPTGPTPTNTPEFSNDGGVWVSSVPADGTKVNAETEFNVTVTLMNTGNTTWTTAYYIKFDSGDQMDAPEKIFMPYEVPPEKNVQISLNFKAPANPGMVRSDWQIHTAADKAFYLFYFEYEVSE